MDGTTLIGQSTDNNIDGDAVEFFTFTITSSDFYLFAIEHVGGPAPGYMKWIMFDGDYTSLEYEVLSSTSFGHPNAAGGAGVAAAYYVETPRFGVDPAEHESFTSRGGTRKLNVASEKLTASPYSPHFSRRSYPHSHFLRHKWEPYYHGD